MNDADRGQKRRRGWAGQKDANRLRAPRMARGRLPERAPAGTRGQPSPPRRGRMSPGVPCCVSLWGGCRPMPCAGTRTYVFPAICIYLSGFASVLTVRPLVPKSHLPCLSRRAHLEEKDSCALFALLRRPVPLSDAHCRPLEHIEVVRGIAPSSCGVGGVCTLVSHGRAFQSRRGGHHYPRRKNRVLPDAGVASVRS